MKKIALSILMILSIGFTFATTSKQKYVVPHNQKANAYPAHVELSWNNNVGAYYEIYLKEGNRFIRRGETNQNYYLDFINDRKPQTAYTYRIVPKGLSVGMAHEFEVNAPATTLSDEALLDMTQRYTSRYFFEFAHPVNKMARERSNNGVDMVTTGGTGFGIMALIASAERGYYTRQQIFGHIESIVSFLEKSERFHGVWAHWYNGDTGEPFSFSRYDNGGDLVETAFLIQGLLTARTYFKEGDTNERKLVSRITRLWEDVEWDWYTKGENNLYWHWSKQHEWKMNHRIKGFDETLIVYVLAASSPTHPIAPEVYHECYTNSEYFKNGKEYYGIPLSLGMEYGGPLFFTHYSFLGLSPVGLNDTYANYFDRNRSHVLIHRAYAIDNPNKHKGYGANLWGFTSSDDALVGYTSHHPGTDADNGTVSPTAALSSIPYAPQECIEVLKNLYFNYGKQTFGQYGFYDSFNPSLVDGQQSVKSYLAIDQGPIAVMIENYRSGLIWKLFGEDSDVQNGLKKLGFYYKN